MSKAPQQLNTIWEHRASSDAEERLLAAFEMLFQDIPIQLPEGEPI